MSLTTCNVHFTQTSDKIVYVSRSLMAQLQLTGKKSTLLRLGGDVLTVVIKPLKRAGHHLYLSSGVRQTIRVPKSGVVYVQTNGDNEIQLGPLVGILTDTIHNAESYPFGTRSGFIKQVIRSGDRKAFMFSFTPGDINWQQETVNGYFLNPQGGWYRRIVPLPDVIYNRLPNRKAETSAYISAVRERFVKRQIPIFNWSFLNKADVYKLIDNDPEALAHLPESVPNPSSAKIKEMLDKHKFLYYKPGGGSLGIGIYRLTYHPRRGYFVRYRRGSENVLVRYSSFQTMMRMLQARLGSRMSGYVAQQGIQLIELDRCPIDFRFHMHKNGSNRWIAAGVGAKKAGRGSVTTHVKNGGSLLTPDQALSRTFGSEADAMLEKARRVAVKLSEAIERNYPHRLGELGLDIGIDKTGDVWMFEANAKPGRSIFKLPALRSEGKASVSYIVDHCLYLSRFQGGSGQ